MGALHPVLVALSIFGLKQFSHKCLNAYKDKKLDKISDWTEAH